MRKKGKAKKRKEVDSVPDLTDVQNSILDAYALIHIGYNIILERSSGKDAECSRAIVVLQHGVKLLKKASKALDQAISQGDALWEKPIPY